MSDVKERLHQLQTMMNEKPGPIEEIKALYRFSLKDTNEQFDISIENKHVTIGEAGQFSAEPACTICLSEADMIKLLNHELNTTIAYMMGQIKVEGKLGAALKLLEALGEYK